MCLAIPSRVISTDGQLATVEAYGRQRTVSLMLLSEDIAVGDYLLVQAGDFAFEKVDALRAAETLTLLDEIFAQGEADIRAWG